MENVVTKVVQKEEIRIKELIDAEMIKQFEKDRTALRDDAKCQLIKMQADNRRTFNAKRKPAIKYKMGDIVAIKRGGGLKLKPSYIGSYEVSRVKYNNTYDVTKLGNHEGPKSTTTCAEYMKL